MEGRSGGGWGRSRGICWWTTRIMPSRQPGREKTRPGPAGWAVSGWATEALGQQWCGERRLTAALVTKGAEDRRQTAGPSSSGVT